MHNWTMKMNVARIAAKRLQKRFVNKTKKPTYMRTNNKDSKMILARSFACGLVENIIVGTRLFWPDSSSEG